MQANNKKIWNVISYQFRKCIIDANIMSQLALQSQQEGTGTQVQAVTSYDGRFQILILSAVEDFDQFET